MNGAMPVLPSTPGRLSVGLSGDLFSTLTAGTNVTEDERSEGYGYSLVGKVHEGYRITSMTLSATVFGISEIGKLPPNCPRCDVTSFSPGRTSNALQQSWTIGTASGVDSLPGFGVVNLLGEQSFTQSVATKVTGDFNLDLQASLQAYAKASYADDVGGGIYDYHWFYSTSTIGIKDMVLTFDVSPVPEPATYAMFAAGLAFLAFAGRKRSI
jgi:hypothetical protein